MPLRLHGHNVGTVTFGQRGVRRSWTRDDVLFGSHLAHLIEHMLSDREHLDIQDTLARSNKGLELRVAERTAELQKALHALEESNLTDPLTGLRNRRFLLQHLDNDALLCARRYEARTKPPGVAKDDADLLLFMVDLDHFKHVNDTHGHQAGDAVLLQIKQRLQRVFRESDYQVRWGGEEFLIVARATARRHATQLAQRVCSTIADEPFVLDDGKRLSLTCSIGFASYPFVVAQPRALSWHEAVGMVDTALYAVKRAGRNGWAGWLATDKTRAETMAARLKSAPRAAIDEGEIDLTTSLDRQRVLNAL